MGVGLGLRVGPGWGDGLCVVLGLGEEGVLGLGLGLGPGCGVLDGDGPGGEVGATVVPDDGNVLGVPAAQATPSMATTARAMAMRPNPPAVEIFMNPMVEGDGNRAFTLE